MTEEGRKKRFRSRILPVATVAVVLIIIVGVTTYTGITYYSPGGEYWNAGVFSVQRNASKVIFHLGATIVINSSDVGSRDGPMSSSFSKIHHSISYLLDVKGYYLLTGSWRSSGESFLYIYNSSRLVVTLEPPYPFENHGTINMALSPGNYTIWMGGYVGDRISITSDWKLDCYSSENVTLTLPQSANNTTSNPQTFLFHNVSFTLFGVNSYSPAGTELKGWVIGANGTNYSLSISGIPSPSPKIWFSPDGDFGIRWYGSIEVELFVIE